MFFTLEDYKKIYDWIRSNSIKDTEFNNANTPLKDTDTITLVLNNTNVRVSLKDFTDQLFLMGVSDFLNISHKYGEYYITLQQAIELIPYNSRKRGQVITFLDELENWRIYLFRGEINQWNILHEWLDILDFEPYIINSILPDEEDLTKTKPDLVGNTYLSLKDREYNPKEFSGMGKIILRKNIVEIEDPVLGKIKKNVLYQDMFTQSNTIYEIRYDFDFNNQTITIPEKCVLDFLGGSFNNGEIVLNNNINIINNYKIFTNIVFKGEASKFNLCWIYDNETIHDFYLPYCKCEYFIPDNCILGNNIIVPDKSTLVGNVVNFLPTNNNCSIILGRDTKIIFQHAILLKGYNGTAIEINSNNMYEISKKYKIISDYERSLANINISVCHINSYNGEYSDRQYGDFIHLLCDGTHNGFWGVNIHDCFAEINIDNFIHAEVTKISTNKASWITGCSVTDISIMFINNATINLDSEFVGGIGGWNISRIQHLYLGGQRSESKMLKFNGVSDTYLSQLKPWDKTGQYHAENCINLYFDNTALSGYEHFDSLGSSTHNWCDINMNFAEIPNYCSEFDRWVKNIDTVVTYRQLLNIPTGIYYTEFLEIANKIALSPSTAPILIIILHNNVGTYITAKFRTDISRPNSYKNSAYIVLFKNYIKNLDDTVKPSDWCYDNSKEEKFKNYYFGVGNYDNRPDINSVPEGYIYKISTETSSFLMKMGNVYKKIYGSVYNKGVFFSNEYSSGSLPADDGGVCNIYASTSTSVLHLKYNNKILNIPLILSGYTSNIPSPNLVGMLYTDRTTKKLYHCNISASGDKMEWQDCFGNPLDTNYYGTFANKPNSVNIGFSYFCTDKSTTEGITNGIVIYHKGNNVWVDALGRVIT